MSRMLTTYVYAEKERLVCLETGTFIDGSLPRGHLPDKITLGLLKGWPYKKWSTCIQFTKYNFYHSTGMWIRSNSQTCTVNNYTYPRARARTRTRTRTRTRIDVKGWEDIERDGKGWPPNFQPIWGRRRCDSPVL